MIQFSVSLGGHEIFAAIILLGIISAFWKLWKM